MSYQPIESYGMIGDMHSVALVSMQGSIDWLCFSHVDSPTLFAALLDDARGGRFSIAPEPDGVTYKQFYWPDTNVLVTRFLDGDGVGEVIDFMPVGAKNGQHGYHQLVRRVRVVRGRMAFRMRCRPAFNFACTPHTTALTPEGARFATPELNVGLATLLPLEADGDRVSTAFTLAEGQTVSFLLSELPNGQAPVACPSEGEIEARFEQTVDDWHRWLARCTYTGRWREMVYRSALCLKLLTFEPTGAIVAAPTCSLPEAIGGGRNWDYRYTWIRDAAFTVYALMRTGFTEEVGRFMNWVEQRAHEPNPDGSLQIMYSIDGATSSSRRPSTTWRATTVRARCGWATAPTTSSSSTSTTSCSTRSTLYNKYGAPISYDFWTHLRGLADYVCEHWQHPDEGIWEVRGGRRHFVYSKLMCWVALDRALRLADKRSFPADRARWLAARDQIYEEIMERGWSEEIQAFVQSYDGETLDASNLLMPLVFFVAPNDPRMLATLDAIERPPERGGLVANSLVYRYDVAKSPDGLDGEEGTFNICTFWLVEALTRAGRTDRARLDEARLVFERMLTYANHLGLYAEETGPRGEALGNFPQAFTHLTLISAAFNLDRALDGG